jgi:Protein of unknown function (DUF2877)
MPDQLPGQRSQATRAAASTRTRHLLAGPRRPGQVLGVFPTAVYVGFSADEGSELLVVETADGLGLPRAVTVAAASRARPLRVVRIGHDAHVGDGRLDVGPLALDVVRWWSPRRPRTLSWSNTSIWYDDARLDVVSRLLPALPADLEDRLASLTRVLETNRSADLQDAVTALLGLGAGLTPQGDDVLAGLLVGLAAASRARPLAHRLGAVVTGLATSRTTTLSAALLRDAADGFAVPALVDLVDGMHEVEPSHRTTGQRTLADVVLRLLAVGHTSGAALAHGAVAAARLHVAAPTRGDGVLT